MMRSLLCADLQLVPPTTFLHLLPLTAYLVNLLFEYPVFRTLLA